MGLAMNTAYPGNAPLIGPIRLLLWPGGP
jgi:hypothetical protein